MKWPPRVAGALLLLALLPALGVAAPADPALRGLRGRPALPVVFRFSDLPRALPNAAAPGRGHKEGLNPEAEEQIEALKRSPRPPRLAELSQVTMDSSPGGLAPLAPAVGAGFEGIHQNGWIPGEPTVAAGPLNLFSAGNVSVTVCNKNGSSYVETPGTNFFHVGSGEGVIADPQCWYDAVHGRFVAVTFTKGASFSWFYLAVSQTSDARGLWYVYKFDWTLDGSTPTGNWGDYPGIGVSEDKLAVSSQQFALSNNVYQYPKLRIFDRAAAYAGGPLGYVDFVDFPPPPSGNANDVFVTKPARGLSPGDSTIHCLCVRVVGGSRVTYRSVTGPPSAPSLSSGTTISVSSYSPPPDAAQLGTTVLLPTNDCRPTDFYVRNGVLICAWHTAADFGSGAVSALRLFRMSTDKRDVLTDETYGQDGVFYYFPAVTVDSVGTVFLGFGRSSASEYPSAWVTGKRRTDTSLEPSAIARSGTGYNESGRWGDYTGIDQDAALSGPAGAVAWYAGLWTKGTSAFGTWLSRVTFTYGVIAGTVLADADGNAATSGDRVPLQGVALTLQQGSSAIGTATSDSAGAFSFGYLESGTYDVVATMPAGTTALDAVPGSGGTSQTRVSAADLQVGLTNAQASGGNSFLVNISSLAAVEPGAVRSLELAPIAPNPVHGAMTVSFALPERAAIRLTVHDVQGREVAVLAAGVYPPGRQHLSWPGAARRGAGLYFVCLRAGGTTLVRRAVVVR